MRQQRQTLSYLPVSARRLGNRPAAAAHCRVRDVTLVTGAGAGHWGLPWLLSCSQRSDGLLSRRASPTALLQIGVFNIAERQTMLRQMFKK